MIFNRITKTFILFCCAFYTCNLYAQDVNNNDIEGKSFIGLAGGMINYSGYMNPSKFTTKNASLSGELMYRYDFNDQFHIRAVGMLGILQSCNCKLSKTNPRYGSFKTGIIEGSILPEYDFLNISSDKWKYKHVWTPYIYAGPALYRLVHYSPHGQKSGDVIYKFGANLRWGLGVKYAVKPGIELYFEGSRREFSKDIDFKNTNVQSRYYSLMLGAIFSLQRRHYVTYW